MLALEDSIQLPHGVRLEHDAVVDSLRNARYPVNATASFVLQRAGMPLGDVAAELSGAYRLDPGRARGDVLAFSLELNRCLLANVRRGGSRVGRLATVASIVLRLAPAGKLPSPLASRVSLDTSSPWRALLTTALALRHRVVVLALLAAVFTAQVTLLSATSASPVALLALPTALAVGVTAHEAGHALALVGVTAALVIAGPRTYVVHARVGAVRRCGVAAAGPALAAGLGVVLVSAASTMGSAAVELALAGCALVAHAVGLTVIAGDGRAACGF